MAEIRERGSVIATEEGSQILKTAKAAKRNYNGKPWTYRDIQVKSGVSEKTIGLFFRQKQAIDESSARAICQALEVEFNQVVDIRPSKSPSPEQKYEDKWQQVCRAMLDRQKQLSTNEIIASEAMHFDLRNDEIFVSLALVERKEPDRLNQQVDPAKPVKRYEEKPPIRYKAFREQVLRTGTSDRIAIVGEPGAGKTTLLQHIAFWILEQELGLPIWISLGDLIKNGELQRLKDYLIQVWLEDAISNVTQDVKSDFLEQLNSQQVWLLLDGADEIFASSSIELHEINSQLRNWLGQACIVLTCRINVWDTDINALRGFQTYRTKEFDYPTQVDQFIENGFRKSNQQSGQNLKTELAKPEQSRLQQLVRNPLRLMMLCTTWHVYKGLPSTKAELYQRFVDEFYKWNRAKWKSKALNFKLYPNTKLKQDKLNKALGCLACRALDEEASPFRLPHNLVLDELGDSEEEGSNFWLALNLGWLQVARNSENTLEKVYTFFHPTFQEYFAALSIQDWRYFLNHRPHDPTLGKYRVFEQIWQETLLLWMGRKNEELAAQQKDELIQNLIHFEDGWNGYYNYRAYFLAATATSEFPESKYSYKIIDNLIEWSFLWRASDELRLHVPDFILGHDAISALKTANHHQSLNRLFELLDVHRKDINEENSIVVYFIASTILESNPGNSMAIQALVELVSLKRRHEALNMMLSSTLTEVSKYNTQALQALEYLFKTTEPHFLKTIIYCDILKAKNATIDDFFDKINIFEGNPQVQRQLLAIAYKIDPEDRRIADCLAELLLICRGDDFYMMDFNFFFEEESLKSNPSIKSSLIKLVHENFEDEDDEFIREFAALNLGELHVADPDVISILINIRDNDFDELNRYRAAKSLTKFGLIGEEFFKRFTLRLFAESDYHLSVCHLADEIIKMFLENQDTLVFVLTRIIKLMINPKQSSDASYYIPTLEKIAVGRTLPLLVNFMKTALTEQVKRETPEGYKSVEQILWHCAQNMSYPDFYRAWHSSSSTDTKLLVE